MLDDLGRGVADLGNLAQQLHDVSFNLEYHLSWFFFFLNCLLSFKESTKQEVMLDGLIDAVDSAATHMNRVNKKMKETIQVCWNIFNLLLFWFFFFFEFLFLLTGNPRRRQILYGYHLYCDTIGNCFCDLQYGQKRNVKIRLSFSYHNTFTVSD